MPSFFTNAETMEDRFWSKVHRKTDDECWEWLAGRNSAGYGKFRVGGASGRMTYAHRVAWELTHGKIPDGLIVRHKCRGKCVNPNHLELGTHADNSADSLRDGTLSRGENIWSAVLTEKTVGEIKRRLNDHESVCMLAKEYGVSHSRISSIRSGTSWSWVTI